MASRRSRPRRLLLPTVLAAVLAVEITGIALARTFAPATPTAPLGAPIVDTTSIGVAGRPMHAGQADVADVAGVDRSAISTASTSPLRLEDGLAAAHAISRSDAGQAVATTVKPRAASTTGSGSASSSARTASYHGRNHVWIPSLGISKTVQSFPCSRSRPPDAGVYRWDCAGHNNVYLLGHAWSTFKPLHDAYGGGRLHAGMKVVYADGTGTVHTYSVIWWKVVAPTTAASWAWASLSAPSMTLETCVGANSAYRLMVRLVRVG